MTALWLRQQMPRVRRFGLCGAVAGVLLGGVSSIGSAQELALANIGEGLPEAPGRGVGGRFSGFGAEQQAGSASVSGTVLDIREDVVPGAKVTLVGHAGGDRVVTSDSEGLFNFEGLSPGSYKITITSSGLETFVSSDIVLSAGEKTSLPKIALPMASATDTVQVTVTEVELAQEQVKAAEKQRVFGVLPNFYSSYIWNAAPLGPKQKFDLALHATTDPVVFLATGAIAGVQQARNTSPAFGQGAQGYGKRYGATYADDFIGRMIGSAILPSLLHQDPRYFYRGTGSVPSRAWYAITRAVIAKGDNGKWQPNYSHVLGSFAAGAIDNAYHSRDDRGAGLTLRAGLFATAGNAADNLLREFILRKLTPKVPEYEQGKQ
jgi:hypothetical protein